MRFSQNSLAGAWAKLFVWQVRCSLTEFRFCGMNRRVSGWSAHKQSSIANAFRFEFAQRLCGVRLRHAGKMRARQMRTRSWGEWAEDNGMELFIGGVLPLGLFSLFLMPFVFGGKLPARNPLALTDFERKCVLFLPFAIVFSAFGFFLFVWILSLIY